MLKFQLDTLEGVDESVRAFYTEKDGKYVLGIEGLPQPADVSGLKSKVEELLAEKKSEADSARLLKSRLAWCVKKYCVNQATSKNSRSPGPKSTAAARQSWPVSWSRNTTLCRARSGI